MVRGDTVFGGRYSGAGIRGAGNCGAGIRRAGIRGPVFRGFYCNYFILGLTDPFLNDGSQIFQKHYDFM